MLIQKIRVKLWMLVGDLYPWFLRKVYKMDLGEGVRLSYKARFDKSVNPRGIHIGKNTYVLSGAYVLAHDHSRNMMCDTRIGENCLIGIESIILPGVTIGDEVIVGAGSVVTKDVPSNCVVAGNPAKVVREDVHVYRGRIVEENK